MAESQSLQEGRLPETAQVNLRVSADNQEFRETKNHRMFTIKAACIEGIWPNRESTYAQPAALGKHYPTPRAQTIDVNTELWDFVFPFLFDYYFSLVFLTMPPSFSFVGQGCLFCAIVCWKYITCFVLLLEPTFLRLPGL